MNGRFWTVEDLDEIAALEQECFRQEAWNRRMLADSLLSGHFFGVLLEEGGTIVAYGGMSVVEDEAELAMIATAEMYRRCGRGSKLLADLWEEAKNRGAKRAILEVRVSNASAQLLYLKHGFRGLYCRTRYYPDDEDAVVMVKELI